MRLSCLFLAVLGVASPAAAANYSATASGTAWVPSTSHGQFPVAMTVQYAVGTGPETDGGSPVDRVMCEVEKDALVKGWEARGGAMRPLLDEWEMYLARNVKDFKKYQVEYSKPNKGWSEKVHMQDGTTHTHTPTYLHALASNPSTQEADYRHFLEAIEATQRMCMPKLLLARVMEKMHVYKEQTANGQHPPRGSGANKYVQKECGKKQCKEFMFRVFSDKADNYKTEHWQLSKLGSMSADTRRDTDLSAIYRAVGTVIVTVDFDWQLVQFAYYTTQQKDGAAQGGEKPKANELLVSFDVNKYTVH